MKILFVCLGNICRSPLAQGILEHKVKELKLDWEVDSAGTGSWHIGEPPDYRSVAVAKQFNIDISNQRARQLSIRDFEDYDYILPMDETNLKDINYVAKTIPARATIKSVMDFMPGNSSRIVPDPYFDGRFLEVYHLLNEVMDHVIDEIITRSE